MTPPNLPRHVPDPDDPAYCRRCGDYLLCHGQAPDSPGQRYRLSEAAAAEVALAVVYGGPNPAMPCLQMQADGVTLDTWPTPDTATPTTPAPAPTGPPSSPAAPPTATPPSAYTATAPSPAAHPADDTAGTSATGPTASPSEDPNTPDATAAKEQHAATGRGHVLAGERCWCGATPLTPHVRR